VAVVYRLGVISDLHALGRYALVPPKWWPQGGEHVHPAAKFYSYMWACWADFVKRCPSLDALIVNGDLIEGESPSKRDTVEALSDSFLEQGAAAEEIIGMLTPKVSGPIWIVRGTPYHDGKHFETLESVARNLGAEQWSPGRYTGYVLEGTWRGLALNVTHHMTTGAIYRGTLADRSALFSATAEGLGKANHADLIIRSHLHMKYIGKSHGRWIVLTPAWKLITPYAIKKMEFYRATLNSDLGAILIETDGKGKVTIDDSFQYEPYKAELRTLDAGSDLHRRRAGRRPAKSGRNR
jgi:hypothetical protein